jgi:hypothetical protein
MPLKYPDYQREFTFTVNGDGVPIARVITLGQGRWLTVCPCCGCAHDVTTFKGDVYEPKCILKVTHPKVYDAWLKRFPDAAQVKQVQLVVKRMFGIVPFSVKKTSTKKRKAA